MTRYAGFTHPVKRKPRNWIGFILMAAISVWLCLLIFSMVWTTYRAIDLSSLAVPQHYDCPTRKC